jgi:hypothetical protein
MTPYPQILWIGSRPKTMLRSYIIQVQKQRLQILSGDLKISSLRMPSSFHGTQIQDLQRREVGLVHEWLQSSKDFHIIRDHKHHMVPILAGTFGCRNNCLEYIGVPTQLRNINSIPTQYMRGEELFESYRQSIPIDRDVYLVDQIFLAQYVYNFINSNMMVHCSHNAYEPFAKKLEPIETGFVGEVVTECPRAAEIMGDTETNFERVGSY